MIKDCLSRKASLVLALMVACALIAPAANAQNTIHVPADQTSIQAAINAALPGDTVLVAPGTYFENINFSGKPITVVSSDGPSVTTIDGSRGVDSVVKFVSGESNAAVLRGFTITHGNSMFNAGGIQTNNSAPTIDGNVITANTTCDSGAGLQIAFSSAIIKNNTITNNTRVGCTGGVGGGGISIRGAASAQVLNNLIANNSIPGGGDGGGISLFGAGTATISGNTITGNISSENGGAISMANQSDAIIVDNLIYGNTAQGNGGGVYFLVPGGTRGPFLVNNTIASNIASQGSAVFADGFDSQSQLVNNIFFSNTGSPVVCGNFTNPVSVPVIEFNDAFSPGAPAFSGTCANLIGTGGNISADPLFVNATSSDFHVQAGSPVIDVGNNGAPNLPQKDLDGNSRIAFGNATTCSNTVDMGAYESVLNTIPSATLSPASLDFGGVAVGTASNPQTATFTATQGCVAKPTVTSSGDFHETDNCSQVLGTGASCSVQVTFLPTTSGTRAGALAVTAGNISLSSNLTGQGQVAIANLAPTSLDFGSQPVGNLSVAQTVTLTSAGSVALEISAINLSGDFAQSNNCPASLLPGASCTISVRFAPTATGARSGALVVSTNGGVVSSSLSGVGVDYALAASPASVAVRSGKQVQTRIIASSVGGSFGRPVALSCSNLPRGATCSFAPASVTPAVGSASSTLNIDTQMSGGIKTARGTYSITVNGASGGLVRSTVITLTVQ